MKFLDRFINWLSAFVRRFRPVASTVKSTSSKTTGKRGRPRLDIVKDVSRPVRWSALEFGAVQRAAEHRGLSVSCYIRQIVLADAGSLGRDEEEEGRG